MWIFVVGSMPVAMMLQLSLCILTLIQLTSSQSVDDVNDSDVTAPRSYVNSTSRCTEQEPVLNELVTVFSQSSNRTDHVLSQLTTAVAQLQTALSQLQTGVALSQVKRGFHRTQPMQFMRRTQESTRQTQLTQRPKRKDRSGRCVRCV